MSNVTIDTEKAPAAETATKANLKKASQSGNRAKKGKPGAKAKAARKHNVKAAPERSNKKADVIAMMRRAKGATLDEIMEATGWQKHTVRGFVSILGSKGGEKIESAKNTAGDRTYRIAK